MHPKRAGRNRTHAAPDPVSPSTPRAVLSNGNGAAAESATAAKPADEQVARPPPLKNRFDLHLPSLHREGRGAGGVDAVWRA